MVGAHYHQGFLPQFGKLRPHVCLPARMVGVNARFGQAGAHSDSEGGPADVLPAGTYGEGFDFGVPGFGADEFVHVDGWLRVRIGGCWFVGVCGRGCADRQVDEVDGNIISMRPAHDCKFG